MCGIAGMCNSQAERVDSELLARMIAMVHHRGPDARGVHADCGIGLANARLSIIDLSGGAQPMHNEDKSLWITFNGEIFNYVELRQELLARGHRFATESDTEVILHLYEEEGEQCVRHLNGQWGFAIWDVKARRLFLSRDRLGVRPLFYTVVGNNLIFGSEIKSIFAHPDVPRGLDLIALDQIFTFWVTLAPRTIFKGVCELPPGHSLVFESGRVRTYPYWQLDFDMAPDQPRTEEDYAEELGALLSDATRIRLRADVPVGVLLSGGLDSTIITALTRKFAQDRLRTFSVRFAARELDESAFQREAVEFFDTSHDHIRCDGADIARVFASVIWHTEKPVIRAAPAPLYLLSQLIRDDGYKVVLTGEGADEVFGGYDIYKEAKIRRFCAAQPSSRHRLRLLRRLYPYQENLQRQPDLYLQNFFRAGQAETSHPFFSHLPRWELTSRLKLFFSDEARAQLREYDAFADLRDRLPAGYLDWHPFGQSQYLETMFLLPGYILSSQGDRMAMAHSVEARHPFLDYRVVEFAAKLPPQLKMKVLNEKYILKRAFGSMVPPAIAARPKQPYRAPDGRSFFAAPRQGYVEALLAPDEVKSSALFDASSVGKLVSKFTSGRALGVKDDMALVGILSTQLLIHQFIVRGASSCGEMKASCAVS